MCDAPHTMLGTNGFFQVKSTPLMNSNDYKNSEQQIIMKEDSEMHIKKDKIRTCYLSKPYAQFWSSTVTNFYKQYI